MFPEEFVNSEMTYGLACFMTDLAGQRPNRLSAKARLRVSYGVAAFRIMRLACQVVACTRAIARLRSLLASFDVAVFAIASRQAKTGGEGGIRTRLPPRS
jgi:hypothetical protein